MIAHKVLTQPRANNTEMINLRKGKPFSDLASAIRQYRPIGPTGEIYWSRVQKTPGFIDLKMICASGLPGEVGLEVDVKRRLVWFIPGWQDSVSHVRKRNVFMHNHTHYPNAQINRFYYIPSNPDYMAHDPMVISHYGIVRYESTLTGQALPAAQAMLTNGLTQGHFFGGLRSKETVAFPFLRLGQRQPVIDKMSLNWDLGLERIFEKLLQRLHFKGFDVMGSSFMIGPTRLVTRVQDLYMSDGTLYFLTWRDLEAVWARHDLDLFSLCDRSLSWRRFFVD